MSEKEVKLLYQELEFRFVQFQVELVAQRNEEAELAEARIHYLIEEILKQLRVHASDIISNTEFASLLSQKLQ